MQTVWLSLTLDTWIYIRISKDITVLGWRALLKNVSSKSVGEVSMPFSYEIIIIVLTVKLLLLVNGQVQQGQKDSTK